MKNTYSIGRSENSDFTTPNQKIYSDVGRVHAQFVLTPEGMIDLIATKKSYLLFVNGFRVFRKRITAKDILQLGKSYQFRLGHYFKLDDKGQIIGKKTNLNDFSGEFDVLKNNWEANLSMEKNLKGPLNMNLRVFDFIIVFAGMGILSKFVPWGVSLIFLVLLPFLKGRNGKKIKQLKPKMEQEHICPKCKHYFKDLSWTTAKAMKGHQCGAKWG